jgi:Family of unknown function (DUF5997)
MADMSDGTAALDPRRAAAALGISRAGLRRAGMDRSYSPAEIAALKAAPPEWLLAARFHRQAQRERERADRERRVRRDAEEMELTEASLRAVKDRGHTDAWAAGVLRRAGIHEIDLGEDGGTVPVLPPLPRARSDGQVRDPSWLDGAGRSAGRLAG